MSDKNPRVFLVGRSKECDIVLSDQTVSRRHAELIVSGEREFMLVDCDSKFGTFVRNGNEWRSITSARVGMDDRVRLGQFETSIRSFVTVVVEQLRRAEPPAPRPSTVPTAAAPAAAAAPPTTAPAKRTIFERNPETGEIVARKDH